MFFRVLHNVLVRTKTLGNVLLQENDQRQSGVMGPSAKWSYHLKADYFPITACPGMSIPLILQPFAMDNYFSFNKE